MIRARVNYRARASILRRESKKRGERIPPAEEVPRRGVNDPMSRNRSQDGSNTPDTTQRMDALRRPCITERPGAPAPREKDRCVYLRPGSPGSRAPSPEFQPARSRPGRPRPSRPGAAHARAARQKGRPRSGPATLSPLREAPSRRAPSLASDTVAPAVLPARTRTSPTTRIPRRTSRPTRRPQAPTPPRTTLRFTRTTPQRRGGPTAERSAWRATNLPFCEIGMRTDASCDACNAQPSSSDRRTRRTRSSDAARPVWRTSGKRPPTVSRSLTPIIPTKACP